MGKKKKRRSPDVAYWHGGAAGLTERERLLPLSQVPERHELLGRRPIRHADVYDPHLLYVTTDRDLAIDYAIRYVKSVGKPAALYKVKPLGNRAHDEDYPRGVSFGCAEGALVLQVTSVEASMAETGAARAYKTWDDDSPMYDAEGHALPNKVQKHLKITASDLRQLGIDPDYEHIVTLIGTLAQQRNPGLTQADVFHLRGTL